jgi:hypothetical protein
MPTGNPVPALTAFENRDVVQSTIRVTRAGDGLSQALAVEPAEFHLGETRYIVLECQVAKVHYEELGDTGCLRRVHTLAAGAATIVDHDLVGHVLAAQKALIDRAKGIHPLPFDDDDMDGDGDE